MKGMKHDGPDGICNGSIHIDIFSEVEAYSRTVVRVILQGRGRPAERSFLGPDFICRLRTKLSEVEHIDVTVLYQSGSQLRVVCDDSHART